MPNVHDDDAETLIFADEDDDDFADEFGDAADDYDTSDPYDIEYDVP